MWEENGKAVSRLAYHFRDFLCYGVFHVGRPEHFGHINR